MPNIKYKYSLTYEYFRALIFAKVVKNSEEAIRLLTNLINEDNYFVEASFSLWKILQKLFLQKEKETNSPNRSKSQKSLKPSKQEINSVLLKFSYFMIKICQNEEVSFSDWIKAYILYSKSLYYNERYDQAIQVLISLLDIFANMPHEDIKFLSEINKDNKISITNVFVNFDTALNFYSKYHVFKKCEEIFLNNYYKKENIVLFENVENINNFEDEHDIELENKLQENLLKLNLDLESKKEKVDVSNDNHLILQEGDSDSIRSLEKNLMPIKSDIIKNKNSNKHYPHLEIDNKKNDAEKLEKSLSTPSSGKPKKNMSNLIYDPNFIDLSNEFNNIMNDENDSEIRKVCNKGDDFKIPDLNIRTLDKFEEYLDNNIDNLEVQQDNFTCKLIHTYFDKYFYFLILVITIISNPIILYEIGKLCAKTKSKLELGLMCLNDFNLIIKFQNNHKLTSYHEKKKLKAKFWKGLIHTLLNNFK
jgi:hypothetical protein